MPTSLIGNHCNGNSWDIGCMGDSPYSSVLLRKTPYKNYFYWRVQSDRTSPEGFRLALVPEQ